MRMRPGSTAQRVDSEPRYQIFLQKSAPGGITRRYAPRPFGVALPGDRRRGGVVEPSFFCRGFDRSACR